MRKKIMRANWMSRNCVICDQDEFSDLGYTEYHLATQGGTFDLTSRNVSCNHCGFVSAKEVPDEDFLARYYTYHTSWYFDASPPPYNLKKRLKLIQMETTSALALF